MDVDHEGAGGGARNQSTMVVVKSEAVRTSTDPPVVDPEPVEDVGGDTTECSSSFGDTCSGVQDAPGDGEPEVNSGMSAHANGSRPWKPPRKKVTAEWRNYVRPILWRCQWLGLRMRELSSQVSKYDRELALNKKQKELQAASKPNGSMSESMQIHKGHGNSIMKRTKRKRHEENLDTPLYINKHQILSYYHGLTSNKQNKGAETDGLLIDDDCGSTVPIRGGLDSVTLLDSEDYDVIFEQLSLKDILLTIDGVQSRVHLLRGRLSKAHYEGRNLAFSEGNTHVRVAPKRQHTQKRSSYTECRYTKPQKKKNLNVLLKDDSGPAFSGRPSLPDRETDTPIKDADRIAEERSGEGKHSREKAITMDLLLGIGNYIPNGYIEDLCKENADDILIDNQATSDVCQQFDKAKHLPSGTSSKEQNVSAPVEVKNTCAPVKVDSTCAPVEVDTTCALAVGQESSVEKSPSKEPVSSGSKQEPNSKKKRRKKGSLFTRKKQRKEASKTAAAKEKTEGRPSAANTWTESTPSAVAKQKTEGTRSAATGPQTMTARSAGKKLKSVNEPADVKEHGSGNSFSASTEQKTGKPSSAMKRKEASETPAAKEKTEGTGTLSAANTQTESTPSAVAKQKTEGTRSAATGPETMTARSAGKKRKSVNEPADAKEHGSGNSFSASMEQKTWKPSSAMKKQKTEKSSTAAKKHGSGNSSPASMEQTIGKLFSAVKKQKTETSSTAAKKHGSGNKSSASMEQKTGKPSSAAKKQKTETSSTAGKEHGPGNSTSASKEQKTGKGSSAVKQQETVSSSAAANKQEAESASSAKKKQATDNSSSKAKKEETAASAPSKLLVEKAVLVAVDGRRSQRVRKPKVFAE
ncbi:uncharacterized protein [Miscanthus floridulus]|uniref:uncharacterized protein isoform X1 n=1 Tax=Miscanthus floridulus TaxID=154761 RepID=UPI003459E636